MNARPVACPSLVGRDNELAFLHDARRALGASRTAFVLIAGEAGIGKSRLLAQFLRDSGGGRARTLVPVECLEYAPAPFGPIRDAVETLARITETPLPPMLARFVERSAVDAAPEKAELFAAIVTFIRERAQVRAIVLSLEDVHWADATTLEFLAYAASRVSGTRLLVIATYRSDEVERNAPLAAALARIVREPATYRLELAALGKAELGTLLSGALDGHPPLAARVLEDVATRSEGNPFFAEELLKDALEHSPERSRPDLPISIRASIVERLRGFSEDERRVIDRAAVLGLRFDPHVLARTLNTDIDAILPTLRRARDANLIVEQDARRVQFRFRHALTRQVVYDDLLLFDARRTHRSVLETLESFGAEDEHIEELAYHAWEARDTQKSLRYNERAAEAAFALFALPEARVGFERSLQAATQHSDEARLLERLGRVTSLLGELPAAIELFETARAAAVEIGDFEAAARITRWSAADRANSGDASAVTYGVAFLERFGDRVPVAAADELVAMIARVATMSYDVEGAERMLARIVRPEALPPSGRHNALIVRSEIAWIRGDALAWSGAAGEIFDLLPAMPAFPALVSAYTLAQAASLYARDDLVARALAHADRIESRSEIAALRAYGASVRALDHFARGELEAARADIRRAMDSPGVATSTSALALTAPFVAEALDDDSLISLEMERTFAEVRANARHPDDAVILAGSAIYLMRRGRTSEALADLHLAVSCLPHAVVHSDCVLTLAALHFDVAELASLERFTDVRSVAEADRIGRANALATASIIAQRRGDLALASASGSEAAEIYRSLGRPLLEARALRSAGRTDEARAQYERCGAVGAAKRLGGPKMRPAATYDALSQREREVARFVAAGMRNVAIAERLSITKKTVEKHVGSIYDKLGVRSRAQLASLVARAGQDTPERSEIKNYQGKHF